jgi:hypothetical protein
MLDVASDPTVEIYPCLHTTNTPLEIYHLALRRVSDHFVAYLAVCRRETLSRSANLCYTGTYE